MQRAFLGVDIGSISTKAVVIGEDDTVLFRRYIWTEGDPIKAVRTVLQGLEVLAKKLTIVSAGTTGSARKLAGALIGASVVKNEITAHAAGTLLCYPEARTIFEIGGQDSKIIFVEDGVVTDYAMNTLCAAGTGAFLSSQALRLGLDVSDFGPLALASKNPASIAARCTVFAESDLVHKLQTGYKKEDIVAGLCRAVASNYLNNLAKGKKLYAPIVFQGGVSLNAGVVQAFERQTGEKMIVDKNAHLFGALGAARLAKESKTKVTFNKDAAFEDFKTLGSECKDCPNCCELISVYRSDILVDRWGARCSA